MGQSASPGRGPGDWERWGVSGRQPLRQPPHPLQLPQNKGVGRLLEKHRAENKLSLVTTGCPLMRPAMPRPSLGKELL